VLDSKHDDDSDDDELFKLRKPGAGAGAGE
jgi:hypothetical protein